MTPEPARKPSWCTLGLSTAATALALPPASLPLASLFVLLGVSGLFGLCVSGRRPYLSSYLYGVVVLGWMSWSLRYLTVPGFVAIGVLGGLYFVLTAVVTRFAARFGLGALGFAVGLAGTQWARSHLPEIWYPHGQMVHALYEHPVLLGSLRYVGESGANFLLAFAAASLWTLARSWQRAEPKRSVALRQFGIAVVLLVGPGLLPSPIGREPSVPVDVLAVEPGLPGNFFESNGLTRDFLVARLRDATLPLAGVSAEDPPDLVVWPESSFPRSVGEDVENVFEATGLVPPGSAFPIFAPGVRLLAGGELLTAAGRRRGVTLLVDAEGSYLARQEKIHPVPGGERVPFLDILPRAWLDRLIQAFTGLVRRAPDLQAGEPRPALETASGQRFAAFLCFDNAFDDVSRHAVESGAEFCVVASNEAWYRQGGELQQMVAMTVCRAIETGLPWIRSTVDGLGVVVEPDGRITAELPQRSEGETGPRVLRATLAAAAVRHPTLGLQAALGPVLATLVAVATILSWFGGFRRRRRARS